MERGLTKKEAEKKLKQYGLNEIIDISRVTPLKILLRQIKSNFIVYLLFVAIVISFFVGKEATAYAVLAVLIIIVGMGFLQEYRSEKSISALKSMLTPVSVVRRDGKEQEIQSSNLVPGDIIILRNGENIPADCIILEERELRLNESVLTGESREVKKKASAKKEHSNNNMVFMGSFIVNGRCTAKVVHTGMNTKFGNIAKTISTAEKALPLQKKVNRITKIAVILAMVISVITGIILLARNHPATPEVVVEILIFIIALAIASFPESLPLVLTTTLASGAYKMSKQNAIINRMSVIETLGETTVICSDKTGTITKGEMTVKKIYANGRFYDVSGAGYDAEGEFSCKDKKIDIKKEPFYGALFNNAILCNDAKIERKGQDDEFKIRGSPTESALLVLAAKAGLYKEDIYHKRIQEIPFNSDRKMMSVSCQINKEKMIYSKGAPEYLIKHCRSIQKGDKIVKLTEKDINKILAANDDMNRDSFRVLAFAYKKVKTSSKDHYEKDLIFTGLVGMEDPPREEVKGSIKQCKRAGIDVKMITGDNKETALSIAKQVGLRGKLMLGQEVEDITDEELQKVISSISIFARVKPEHKLRIVNALRSRGEIVTMTGDGVNDAPALKEAHIGVAMGKNGTDVSRSVADLTLKDDNFSTIVNAIEEGRNIFSNIRKFTTYQLSCNFAEVNILFIGVVLAPVFGWGAPLLLALHLLFMNMVTADLPAIALSFTPSSKDAMLNKPRKKAQILDKKFLSLIVINGTIMMLFVLLSYFFTFNMLGESIEYSRTVALMTLILIEVVSAFSFRSFKKGFLNENIFSNPYLFYASAISLIATFAIIYSPLNNVFETVPLEIGGFITGASFSLIWVIIFDVLKYINNRMKLFDFEN